MLKYFILIITLLKLLFCLSAQEDSTYYYYFRDKVFVNFYPNMLCLNIDDDSGETANYITNTFNLQINNNFSLPHNYQVFETRLGNALSDSVISGVLSLYGVNSGGLLLENNGSISFIINLFVVRLSSDSNMREFNFLLSDNHCQIEELFPNDSNIYILKCLDKFNSIHMANFFLNSELFDFAHPVFSYPNAFSSNDPYYVEQWGLHNFGQNNGVVGIDINVEEAWCITKGNANIKIAVLDRGIDVAHPDLSNNIYTVHNYCPDQNYEPPIERLTHGTECAGIIAAKADNEIGITGVAPNCRIISVNMSNCVGDVTSATVFSSIIWAYQNSADIISLSWGCAQNDPLIANAVAETMNGRNGLGCVFVCSSGNENESSVSFPSNLNQNNVISVGAIDRCGARAGRNDIVYFSCDPWPAGYEPGSNYGTNLWVVAPGTNVLTTDVCGVSGDNPSSNIPNNHSDVNYTLFGGTSAACPFVAGVAALVLSVNPNLFASSVKSIIGQTAQKINYNNHYPYNIVTSLGMKNLHLGYGLVNAYAAVDKALKSDLYIRDYLSDTGNEPSYTECMWNSPDIWIEDMSGNPIANPVGGELCKVCVRVKSRQDMPSSGNEKLFINWAKAGINLPWPSGWNGSASYICDDNNLVLGGYVGNPEGVTIPSINGIYDYKIIKVNWMVPCGEDYDCGIFHNSEEKWHFCLLVRIHDGNEILGENIYNYPINELVLNNNNVAWKNLSVLESGEQAIVWIWNHHSQTEYLDLHVSIPNLEDHTSLLQCGELYLDFSSNLTDAWINGGQNALGIRYLANNCFRVVDTVAQLSNIMMDGNDIGIIKIVLKFFTNGHTTDTVFDFDISLYNTGNLLGGEHISALYNNERSFRAIALEDINALYNDSISFFAVDIGEPAQYIWYNSYGDTIGIGETCHTIATQSQYYILDVEANADNYKSSDSVKVIVKKGIITSLTPNPAISQLSVTCQLSQENTGGFIQISNMMGIVESITPLNNLSTEQILNIEHLTSGHYTVRLISPKGEVLDAKTLIVQ